MSSDNQHGDINCFNRHGCELSLSKGFIGSSPLFVHYVILDQVQPSAVLCADYCQACSVDGDRLVRGAFSGLMF